MCALVILVVGTCDGAELAASPCHESAGFGVALIRMPVTKGYRISSEFSPVQIVGLVRQFVPLDSSPADYGQFGIPPVYTAGSNVLVRAMPDVHEHIAKYLSDLGVCVRKPIE